MARQISYVANVGKATTTAAPLSLEDIPADIREEVEQAYAALKTNPDGRFRAAFDDEQELRQYVRYVTSYCEIRPEGQIRFRKSPTRKLPPNVMDFRITDLLTENEEKTADVREAIVKAGGSDGTPKTEKPHVAAAKAAKAPAQTAGRRR